MTGCLLETISLLLIVIATVGRSTWSSLYISGDKEHRAVCEGPYAILRNPLYMFSFVGVFGLGLANMHLTTLAWPSSPWHSSSIIDWWCGLRSTTFFRES